MKIVLGIAIRKVLGGGYYGCIVRGSLILGSTEG